MERTRVWLVDGRAEVLFGAEVGFLPELRARHVKGVDWTLTRSNPLVWDMVSVSR
jgi:hypothetical protein